MTLESVSPVRIAVRPTKHTCDPVSPCLRNFAGQNIEQVAGSLHAVHVILNAHIIPGTVSEDPGHACENYGNHDYSFGTATHMRMAPNDERSHAGPTAPDCNRELLAALAGATLSYVRSIQALGV